MKDLASVYAGKTVLVTGHTGFKGSWLSIWLHELGAKVVGYALDPENEFDNFNCANVSEKIIDIRGDILDTEKLNTVFEQYQPDFVFHLAAQPLVLESYQNPVYTFQTNLMGTIHVLEGIRKVDKKCIGIMITTDKVYENHEEYHAFKESDAFGGHDPYSASKATCEIAISSYRRSFMNPHNYDEHHKAIASVRAGNVIGGGDWAANRIVPDCIRAIEKGEPIVLRNPQAVRPWELVLEPLFGYLTLGALLSENPVLFAKGYNFGPKEAAIRTVGDLALALTSVLGGSIVYVENSKKPHEANLLMLNVDLVKEELGWESVLSFEETLDFVSQWYQKYRNEDGYQLCIDQINAYMEKVQK